MRDTLLADRPMDFLLECIGFPPDTGEDEVVRRVRADGEPAAWRGAPEDHLVLPLGDGLEVRADRDVPGGLWSLTPHYRSPHRRRLALTSLVRPQDSPFDALLVGWGDPPPAGLEDEAAPGTYRLSAWISDARRIDRRLTPGHVLALSVAGFAVHVERVGENDEVFSPAVLDRPAGAYIAPLGGADAPGGCCDVSLRVRGTRRLRNDVTGETVWVALCDAPDRPMALLLSRWQLERDGWALPRPGSRIEGTFLFTGRIAGGLKRGRTAKSFG